MRRTLPGPTLGRIGRLALTRPPGEQVTGHRDCDGHRQVGGGNAAAVVGRCAAQLPLLLQELGMEPVLQWAAPRRTGSHTNNTQAMPYYLQVLKKWSKAKSDKLVYKGGFSWNKLAAAFVEVTQKTGLHFLDSLYLFDPRTLTHYDQVT